MTVIDFQKARGKRLYDDAMRLAREADNHTEVRRLAYGDLGFEFPEAGEDRWGDFCHAIAFNGQLLIDGSAELCFEECLECVSELLTHCASPAQYRVHAQGFAECAAENHAELDAIIAAGEFGGRHE